VYHRYEPLDIDKTYPTLFHHTHLFLAITDVSEDHRHGGHIGSIWYPLLGINVSKVPAERLTVKALT